MEADNLSKSGLRRALAVIYFVVERAPEQVGVSAAARELNLSKAVTHRILKECVADGLLTFDEQTKKYELGWGAMKIGMAGLRLLDVPRIAKPYLDRLVRETGETATLSVRRGWHRIYVGQVLSPHALRMSVMLGTIHSLHAGASSKTILAFLGDEEIEEFLERGDLPKITDFSITSPEVLRDAVKDIRALGYASSLGERESGAVSVAAPVFGVYGEVWGAISICGPGHRFDSSKVPSWGRLVIKASTGISAELGGGSA